MKRQVKTLIVVAAFLATIANAVTPAAACGGRGGYGGFGGFPRASSFARTSSFRAPYSTPRYSQPQSFYGQPQPVYNQPQPLYPQPQSIQPQQVFGQPQRQVQRLAQPSQQSQQIVQRPAVNQQQGLSSGATAPGSASLTNLAAQAAKQATNSAPAKTAESSALQMLASVTASSTQPVTTSPVQQVSATTPSIPEFTPAPSNQVHVGNWKVDLTNSQTVELRLDADGKFVWTAVSKGNRKTFAGQYRLDDGRLTLVRTGDLQQMSGSWTGDNNQFTFKLDGSSNGGLSFKRV